MCIHVYKKIVLIAADSNNSSPKHPIEEWRSFKTKLGRDERGYIPAVLSTDEQIVLAARKFWSKQYRKKLKDENRNNSSINNSMSWCFIKRNRSSFTGRTKLEQGDGNGKRSWNTWVQMKSERLGSRQTKMKSLREKGIWISQLEKKKVLERYEQSITNLHYCGAKKEQL